MVNGLHWAVGVLELWARKKKSVGGSVGAKKKLPTEIFSKLWARQKTKKNRGRNCGQKKGVEKLRSIEKIVNKIPIFSLKSPQEKSGPKKWGF